MSEDDVVVLKPRRTGENVESAYEVANLTLPNLPLNATREQKHAAIRTAAEKAFDSEVDRFLLKGYDQDGATKHAYALAILVYKAGGFGDREAAAEAGDVKKRRGERNKVVPVVLSILIFVAAYLISNWDTYTNIISGFFLAR
ncbi:MAG TPA: hypothetical protein VI933_01210 [archaeon]|nr:hypothetical protein [archaeon]